MKKILFLLLFPFQVLFSQNSEAILLGLWEITEVIVGNEIMTPIGKWMDFKPDHTQYSGNGWVQHSIYTWQFDDKQALLDFQTVNGIEDPDGPFSVKIGDGNMTWERKENGMNVIVSLKKIDRLPAAYSDNMIGLWKVVSIPDDAPSFPFENNTVLFMRADRRYSIRNETGNANGVWHAHAHRQHVRLLSDESDATDMNCEVFFEGEKMVWVMKGVKLIFERIHRF